MRLIILLFGIVFVLFISRLVISATVNINTPTQTNPNAISKTIRNGTLLNPNVIMNPYIATPPKLSVQGASGANVTTEDGNISAEVQARISADKNLVSMNITVSTQQGFVTLRGSVNELSKVNQAIDIARKVPGVKAVRSEITVNQ